MLKFFDVRGYLIMAVMMGGGIALRSFHLVPGWFIAFFYTGLGIALALCRRGLSRALPPPRRVHHLSGDGEGARRIGAFGLRVAACVLDSGASA